MAKSNKVKMYVCSMNIRPRVDGKPFLIASGSPFDGALLDKESLDQMIKAGSVKAVDGEAEAPKAPKTPSAEEAPKEKPKGVWDFSREDMEKLDIVTLNALYKERAEENGLDYVLVSDKEEMLNIICSEA